MSVRVMFYVQHLLGIGHVMRAAAIVRELVKRGAGVTLVSGGEPVSLLKSGDADFIQLPPVSATDKYFKVLVDENGEVIDDDFRARRRERLLEIFAEVRPQVLVIEFFPFGRRQMRFELIPLLDAAKAARPSPSIVSSVRDILVKKNKPERNVEMVEMAETYFDGIMVHGDPSLITFDRTFPHASRLKDRLHYTGYVIDSERVVNRVGEQGKREIIVSSAGGGVGEALLHTAMAARPLSIFKDHPWRLLVGHNLPEDAFKRIREQATGTVVVERARSDFLTLLGNCDFSISQGGYNTVVEVLVSGAKNVTVPYAGGEETEQTLRGKLLEARGLTHVLPEDDLTPENLAQAMEHAMNSQGRAILDIDLSGAKTSAEIILALAKEK